jgi:hypothetical protein
MSKNLQAKDISTDEFLAAVTLNRTERWGAPAVEWDVAVILQKPQKVVRAKAAKLIKQGVITGCACGCRGDYEVVLDSEGE